MRNKKSSDLKIIHEVFIITSYFIVIQFFAKIVLHIVFIALKSGNNIANFYFIYKRTARLHADRLQGVSAGERADCDRQ